MAKTIGSFDLASLKNLRDDVTQYFWFESDSSSAWGSGAHVTLYPESQFTDSTHPNYMKGQNIIMNTDGFSIRNGTLPMMVLDNDSLDFNIIDTINNTYTNQASFGAISTIGVTDNTQSYMRLDYHSLQMIDREGGTYFYVSDLRGANGQYLVTGLTFTGDGTTIDFNLSLPSINTNYTVSVSDSSGGNITKYINSVRFSSAPTDGAIITIGDYYTTSNKAKAYTFGSRYDNNLGAMSCSIGIENTSSGYVSYAEGYHTTASGYYSHAEGYDTTASVYSSHAEGYHTIASNSYSHAEGGYTTASGVISHAEGYHTTASGWVSHAEGYSTTSNGSSSHSEGQETFAKGDSSHAEGGSTQAFGAYSHSEGQSTLASGDNSHAEGYYCQATYGGSHAEGDTTKAQNWYAHSEGTYTIASGEASHAQNEYTQATKKAQTVIGSYNIADNSTTTTHPSGDTDYGQYALIIGNGQYVPPSPGQPPSSIYSNALTVDWNGVIAFGDPANTFVTSSHTILSSKTFAQYNVESDTKVIAPSDKADYFPVAIVGHDNGSGDINASVLQLSARSKGSATVSYTYKHIGANVSRTVSTSVRILWVKVA